MAQLHFTAYVDKHKDVKDEVEALKIAGENLVEDLTHAGYEVQGIRSVGREEPHYDMPDDLNPVQQAETIVQAHALAQYESTHRAEVKERGRIILDAVQEAGFSAAMFDIQTQAFIGRFIHNILESREPFGIRDGLWLMAIGYYLGKEGDKWKNPLQSP